MEQSFLLLKITLDKVLEEYDKYILSGLINKPYDFSKLRKKVREFSKKYNLFDYDESQTDKELALEISKKIKIYNNNIN